MVATVTKGVNTPKPTRGSIPKGGVPTRKIDLDLMFSLHEDGMTRADIAMRFDVTQSAITHAFRSARVNEHSPAAAAHKRAVAIKANADGPDVLFRSLQTATLFESMRMCALLPKPTSAQQLVQRETALKLTLDRGKVLFGWDAASGSGSGAININLLATKAVVNTTQPQQSPAKPHTVPTPPELEHGETLENVTLDVTSEADPSTGPAHLV